MKRFAAIIFFLFLNPAFAGMAGHGSNGVLVKDLTFYTVGSYGLYSNPFGKGTYVSGIDFKQSNTVVASSFPSNSGLYWWWGGTSAAGKLPGCSGGVCGFNNVSYGDYYGTTPQTVITPVDATAIQNFTVSWNISYGANGLVDFNIIHDFFIVDSPHSLTRLGEIEVFAYLPTENAAICTANIPGGDTQLPNFIGAGKVWKVRQTNFSGSIAWQDFLFCALDGTATPRGTLDMKALMQHIITYGTGTIVGYIGGTSLGSEPLSGQGWFIVNQFSAVLN